MLGCTKKKKLEVNLSGLVSAWETTSYLPTRGLGTVPSHARKRATRFASLRPARARVSGWLTRTGTRWVFTQSNEDEFVRAATASLTGGFVFGVRRLREESLPHYQDTYIIHHTSYMDFHSDSCTYSSCVVVSRGTRVQKLWSQTHHHYCMINYF